MIFDENASTAAVGLGLTRNRVEELDRHIYLAFKELPRPFDAKQLTALIAPHVRDMGEAYYVGCTLTEVLMSKFYEIDK